jgi:hypothetical protein
MLGLFVLRKQGREEGKGSVKLCRTTSEWSGKGGANTTADVRVHFTCSLAVENR